MNVDVVLYKLINQTLTSPLLDTIMVFASSKYGWLPLYLLLVFLLLKKKPLKTGLVKVLLLIAAFGISDSFTSRVVKPLFKRQRPYMHSQYEARLPLVVENREGFIEDNRKNYGFVSSHASNFFAVLTLAGILLSLSVRNKWVLWGIAALVAYSRVYLGVHYPSDVLMGGLFGFGLAHGLNFLYLRWIQPRLG